MEAKKFDNGKPSFTAIPKLALREVAKVFTYGKNKYGKFNYSGTMDLTRYLDALHRHLNAFELNEDLDPESKINHLAHVASNAMMALDGILINNVVDDRNKMYLKLWKNKLKKVKKKSTTKKAKTQVQQSIQKSDLNHLVIVKKSF